MMPLNYILKKCNGVNKINKLERKIFYLMFIKLLAKNEKELETLMQIIRIDSQGIGMEFGIKNVPSSKWKVKKRRKNGRIITAKSKKE